MLRATMGNGEVAARRAKNLMLCSYMCGSRITCPGHCSGRLEKASMFSLGRSETFEVL